MKFSNIKVLNRVEGEDDSEIMEYWYKRRSEGRKCVNIKCFYYLFYILLGIIWYENMLF